LVELFLKKLARAWDAESHGNGISFLQSFFLCACGLKEKSVKQVSIAIFDRNASSVRLRLPPSPSGEGFPSSLAAPHLSNDASEI
jgi:hypothetical protein